MKMSQNGLDKLIKPFEGYHSKQPDGSCKAYRCPAGVWTCGWGCTEGVGPNTQWTVGEATDALSREMEQHERHVEGMVKVRLNQYQFDALVSLCYNVGPRAIAKSSLLQHLNVGDYARAASHIGDFKYAKVQGDTATRMKVKPGTSVVLSGLVERRAAETAMFLEAEPVRDMPQKIEPPRTKLDVKAIAKKVVAPVAAAGAAAGEVVKNGIPAVPDVATKSLENVAAWKKIGGGALAVGKEAVGVVSMTGRLWPYVMVAGGAGAVLAFLIWTKRDAETTG